jgi:hypothetical protein
MKARAEHEPSTKPATQSARPQASVRNLTVTPAARVKGGASTFDPICPPVTRKGK